MPVEVDLTGCCKECYMPLHGGVCEFDPEHTPLPQDLDDPELPAWLPAWLHTYRRQRDWDFDVFGPLPPLRAEGGGAEGGGAEGARALGLAPALRSGLPGLPARPRRTSAVAPGAPLCPECLMPLLRGECPLEPGHETRGAEVREAELERSAAAAAGEGWPPAALEAEPGPMEAAESLTALVSLLPRCGSTSRAAPAAKAEAQAVAAAARGVEGFAAPPARPGPLLPGGPPGSIGAWLQEMDDLGFLQRYRDAIAGQFDSPAQVVDVYGRFGGGGGHPGGHPGAATPSLDPRFLDDMEIHKLGHRRLFEKWFAERLGPAAGPAAVVPARAAADRAAGRPAGRPAGRGRRGGEEAPD